MAIMESTRLCLTRRYTNERITVEWGQPVGDESSLSSHEYNSLLVWECHQTLVNLSVVCLIVEDSTEASEHVLLKGGVLELWTLSPSSLAEVQYKKITRRIRF